MDVDADVNPALADEDAAVAAVPSTFCDHERRVLLAEIHLCVLRGLISNPIAECAFYP
jgi:hypothetical protein